MTSTFVDIHNVLLSAATVAAHASYSEDGFRPKDVRFFLNLFLNWILKRRAEEVQYTQIIRYLDDLVTEGYAKKKKIGKRNTYRLTRLGLIELLTNITAPEEHDSDESFFFSIYFIRSYSERLVKLVEKEGKLFPLSLKIELEGLLDIRSHLEEKILSLRNELREFKGGISDALETSKMSNILKERGASLSEIVHAAESKFPYELNSEKPLSELVDELAPEARLWELTEGNKLRANYLFTPIMKMRTHFLRELEKLHKELFVC